MLLDSGAVYFLNCAICHGKNGRGGRGPAVANSDYVMADRERLIRTVLAGVKEPIHVNGVRWKTGEMLGWAETWDDFKIAAVLTYIRAALNDTLVTDCIPEDIEAGTWASCTSTPRDPEDIAQDSVGVDEVAAVRRALGLR
jgi:mono/diheme cytochrome c family protein